MNNQTKETQESRTALRYIAVHKINPHPDNPRKELGDLAELSDSIRNNGILQNLTVVPYVGEETHEVIEGLYRCIIGHRRLAAAKQADPITGLVPYGCGGVEPDLCSQCQGFYEPTDEEDAADD